MPDEKIVTASVLIIGNEILSGRTKDINLNWLACELTAIGIRLREARVISDIEDEIVAAVNQCRDRYDYVFTTGGIGPTHDDITSPSIARAFGVPWVRHPDAVKILEAQYEPGQLNEARLRMATMPKGAELIDNPVSSAPGFRIGNVFVLAGVPSIMRAMFDGARGSLKGGAPVLSVTVSTYLGEGTIAKPLGALQAEFEDLDLGSYPFFRAGRFGTSLVVRGTDRARLETVAERLRTVIRSLGDEPVEGEPPTL
jgi:molybdenum cofactor synthesis domain-containing protein